MKIKNITEKLHRMAEAITGSLLIEDLTKEAVEVCKDIMGADACSIFLIDDKEPDRLIMRASCGYANDLSDIAEYMLCRDEQNKKLGVTAWIAITGNTLQTETREEFRKCPEYCGGKYDKELWGAKDKLRCESFFGAPLKAWDRIFGVLKVESGREGYFQKEDKDILQIIASMITSSIQNLTVIKLFHSLFKIIGEYPTETKTLYGYLANVCAKLVNAEACSIFIPNEKGRLVLRGDYGHDIPLVDKEDDEYTYALGEGVTGIVFQTGKPSSVSSKEEVESHPEHKSKLYQIQWKDKHVCCSWYQFPLGKHKPYSGVMKIENKLGIAGKPIEKGGFKESEKQILEILANSVVPLIVAGEIKEMKDRAVSLLDEIGYTTNIDEIFSPDLLNKIEETK
ncbi:MAG TPA: GAF domain-containing protein [bacterium]|nr:GAF domain-containing protein [bacterium]